MKNNWVPWLYAFMLIAVAHQHLVRVEDGEFHRIVISGVVIPMFAIIAGYLWGVVLRKTKGRGVLSGMQLFIWPHLFWTTFYWLFSRVLLRSILRHEPLGYSWQEIVLSYITGINAFHLWFMPPLIYSMLILLLIFRVVSNKNMRLGVLVGAAAVFYAMNRFIWPFPYLSTLPVLNWFFSNISPYLAYVFPYVCMGAFFAQAKGTFYQQNLFRRVVLPFVWGVGVINICLWENAFVLVLSIWLTALAFPGIYVPHWLSRLLPYTMGIYMVHLNFSWIANVVLHAFGYELFPFWPGWIVGVLCFACSWVSVWLLRKIPHCSNIV